MKYRVLRECVVLIVVVFISNSINCQVKSQYSETRNLVDIEIDLAKGLRKELTKMGADDDLTIDLIPVYMLDTISIYNTDFLVVDTTLMYAHIKYKGISSCFICAPEKLIVSFLEKKNIDPYSNRRVELINKCYENKSNPYFIKILPGKDSNNLYLVYEEKDLLALYSRDGKYYKDIINLIMKKYGSVDRYIEELNFQNDIDSFVISLDRELAISTMQKSYVLNIEYNPNDTVESLNILIEELVREVGINSFQADLIKEKILFRLRELPMNNFCGGGIPFMGEDISPEIEAVLSKVQYVEYLFVRRLCSIRTSKASNHLFMYYLKKEGIPFREVNSKIREVVYD